MKIGKVVFNPETNQQEVHIDIASHVFAFAYRAFWYAALYFLGVASTRAYYLWDF